MPTKTSISQMKYDKEHTRYYGLKLNLTTDADIIEKLTTVKSMQGYIKQLIRDDIAQNSVETDKCIVSTPVPQKFIDELKKDAAVEGVSIGKFLWSTAFENMPWLHK